MRRIIPEVANSQQLVPAVLIVDPASQGLPADVVAWRVGFSRA